MSLSVVEVDNTAVGSDSEVARVRSEVERGGHGRRLEGSGARLPSSLALLLRPTNHVCVASPFEKSFGAMPLIAFTMIVSPGFVIVAFMNP
jgi:hypothetical protein